MAKNRDTSGTLLEEGTPVTFEVDGKKLKGTVLGAHEDGVSVVDEKGGRYTFHALPGRDTLQDIKATGPALGGDELAAFHAKAVKAAEKAAE